MRFEHKTVLLNELVDALELTSGDIAVDCTAGGGGHTAKLLEKVAPGGKVFALDRDQIAINNLNERFKKELADQRLILVKAPFSSLGEVLKIHSIEGSVAAICADLGLSSPQIDHSERGFSFQREGPLDMRMDGDATSGTAADLVNHESSERLIQILREFGEEPKAKQIVAGIIRSREKSPIITTLQLAEIVKSAARYPERSKTHPATRTFMALRMAVNEELQELEAMLSAAFSGLVAKGRLGIISFHSLEDRIVKNKFKHWAGKTDKDPALRDLPIRYENETSEATILRPFPVFPSSTEIDENPRSRSAKLRVIEKN